MSLLHGDVLGNVDVEVYVGGERRATVNMLLLITTNHTPEQLSEITDRERKMTKRRFAGEITVSDIRSKPILPVPECTSFINT